MKRVIIVIFFLLFSSTTVVQAHTLETDGSIGAVLHIEPYDEPIAQTSSNFYLDFKDIKHIFNPQQCNCVVSISGNKRLLISQPLSFSTNGADTLTAGFSFTFPEKGTYVLTVAGRPTQLNTFQPFTLTYDDIHVSPAVQSSKLSLIEFISAVIILLVVGSIILFWKRKNQAQKKGDHSRKY